LEVIMPKRVFEFLNTSLGIWFLSSVVLGGLSFGYTKWSAAQAEATKRQEATLRAKLEVSQRLAQVVAHYERLRRSKKADEAARLEEVVKLLNAAIQPPTSSVGAQGPAVFAAYTEFRDRPMLSMAVELLTLEQSPKGRDAALILYRWTLKVASGEFDGKSIDTIKDAFQALRTDAYWQLPRNEA
jgi:hypothetical protein